jgi:hypothetical protein
MWNLRQGQAIWYKVCLFVCIVSSLLGACSGPTVRHTSALPPNALSWSAGRTLAAIGAKPQEPNGARGEDGAWRDRRVAFGLNNLLAESLYDTGKFRLVEEKDLHQRQLIEELVDLFWYASRPGPSDPELASIGARLEAELLAYGTIGYTRSSAQRIQIGPLGKYQQKLRVTAEVCLFDVSTQATRCHEGEGTAQQEGMGVLYEFRNDRPEFEKTAAGRATKEAVAAAVQALVASIRFSGEGTR